MEATNAIYRAHSLFKIQSANIALLQEPSEREEAALHKCAILARLETIVDE
jgi:hypothetical protein